MFGSTGPCEGQWKSFMSKHPDATKVQHPDRMDRGKAPYSTVDIIRDYFQLLMDHLDKGEYSGGPQDFYNCDESIIDLNK